MTRTIDIWEINLLPKQKSEFFLRQIFSDYLQISAEELAIERNVFGKPYLRNFPGWHFNLSHSDEKMLLAISHEMPVGIDIERIKPRHSVDDVVKRCFSISEQNYWVKLPETEKLSVFYDFWTRKEAVVKGIGRGIALGLNRCEINVNQPDQFLNLPVNENWQTHSLKIASNYRAAIATNYSDVQINKIFYPN